MNENPYKKAMEYVDFDTKFEEQTIALMVCAAQKKRTIRQVRLPVGSWRYIAAAAAIALLFAAVPFIRGLQNTTETAGVTVPMVMTAAGDESSASTKNDPTVITFSGAPQLFDSINKLVQQSDLIIIGKVEKALPVVRIDAVALGLVEGLPSLEENVSSFQIRIDQVIKGGFSPGDTIQVDMSGGLADNIYENYIDTNYPEEGLTYLMFIDRTNRTEANQYFLYMFVGSFDGFSEIADGRIFPQENTSIFEQGSSVDDALQKITEAIASGSATVNN